MLYLLAMILILFAMFSYYTSRRDVMSPTFILSVFFLVCNIFAIVGNNQWKIDINPKLVLVFMVAMTALYLGELIVPESRNNLQLVIKEIQGQNERIDIPFSKIFVIIIISMVILILYISRLVDVAISVGYSGSMLIQYVRIATVNLEVQLGYFYTVFLGFISGSAFICIYIIIYNTFIAKAKLISWKNFIYFIPIIIQIIKIIFSGSRDGLIKIIVMIFACAIIMYQNKIKKVNIGKVLVAGSIVLLAFLSFFVNIGRLKNTGTNSFIEQIFIYVGSSVVALSSWLDKGLIGSNNIFGGETFWGVRYLLNIFFPLVNVQNKFLEFTDFAGGSRTNIYTAFRSFLYDFGWIGLFMIMFFIGFIINQLYMITKKRKEPFLTLIYSYYLFYFIYIIFSPGITSSLFTSNQIFEVFWMYMTYRFILKSKTKIRFTNKKLVLRKK